MSKRKSAETAASYHESFWQIIHRIPCGKVTTYGQIARLAGLPDHSRMVGRSLRNLPASTKLPWHRVVNSAGRISTRPETTQKELLEAEGVVFLNGRISLRDYGWRP